jgi:hypothetical protein
MIDRLEVLVPEDVPKRTEEWRKHRVRPANRSSVYAHTLDADFQLALRVHYDFRVPKARASRHFKIDFTDTRLLSAEDFLWRLAQLFQIRREDALLFRIARIDFAADVQDVPVEWFRKHSRVKRKRKPQSYEVCKTESSKGSVTSVVFGKRPDLYRIYDRVAEKQERRVEILYSGMYSGAPVPTVTRVERQCSGRAIPKDLSTLGGLFEHAAAADPFPGLVCTETKDAHVSTEDWNPQKWLMSVGLATAVKQFGEATVRARLNRAGGNANRLFSQYSELLRADRAGVTADRLREIYRNGTLKQLNLAVLGPDGKVSQPWGGGLLTL